ncbi:MAG: ABC transporter permease subunit [Oscillospiraceae bacterium]|nr:ABC transporter permease subunit [Oscillospiraceae bacterium]
MLNYIHAECYKVTRRKYPYLFLLLVLLGEGLVLFSMWFTNVHGNHNSLENAISILVLMLSIGLYAAIVVCDMVYSDQYRHNTLKNEVSFGLSRARIYFGKTLSAMITAIVLMAVLVGAYLGIAFLTLPNSDPEVTQVMLATLGMGLLTALPLWLGALAVTMALFSNVRSNVAAAFCAVGAIGLLPNAFKLMALLTNNELFVKLHDICLTAPLDYFDGTWASCTNAWAVGMGWLAVSMIVGYLLFRRKEIN